MLVLSRQRGQGIVIGDDCVVGVVEIRADRALIVVARNSPGGRMRFFDEISKAWQETDDTIACGEDVKCTLVDIRGDKVRLGIAAPPGTTVHRLEVWEAVQRFLKEKRENEDDRDDEDGDDEDGLGSGVRR